MKKILPLVGIIVVLGIYVLWSTREQLVVPPEYAIQILRTDPVLSLPGTDIPTLRHDIADLEKVRDGLRIAQTNEDDREMVNDLFPIAFLRALADTEEQRRRALATGSPTDIHRYFRNAEKTLALRTSERDLFAQAFDALRPEKQFRFPTLGGSISTDSLSATLEEIQNDTTLLGAKLHAQKKCIYVDPDTCDESWHAASIESAEEIPDAIPQKVRDVEAFRRDVVPSRPEAPAIIVLRKSTCLGSYTNPQYFALWYKDDFYYSFVSDIFFTDLAHLDAPYPRHQRENLGLTYAFAIPQTFYQCPDLGKEAGLFHALALTLLFAESHNDIAVAERSHLLASHAIDLTEIHAYLDAIEAEAKEDSPTREQIADIELALRNENSGIEYVLEGMTRTLSTNLEHVKANIPVDISVRTLFLTHSAFPSLFFAHAPARIPDTLRMSSPDDEKNYFQLSHLRMYSDLISIVSPDLLRSDMRTFLIEENVINAPK